MDFNILAIIEDAVREADAFENHPAKQLSLEERLLYLQGLALVMNADNDIHADEKEYLRILIKSFDMDESTLDSFVNFAHKPDKDTIQAFFRTYRRRPVAQLFLFDALMMTHRDNQVHENEKAVVDKIADQLEILKGGQKDIFDLFCHIKNRNWQESALYFDCHLLNPEHFKHLLDYHEVELEALLEETKSIRQQRFIEQIRNKLSFDTLQWEPLVYKNTKSMPKATEITCSFIPAITFLSHDLLLPFLQAKLDRGDIRINNNTIFAGSEKNFAYGNLDDLALAYNQEDVSLYVKPDYQQDQPIKVSKTIQEDYFSLFSINSDHPKDINLVLKPLFSAQIAVGRKSDSYIRDICFPQSNGAYLKDEIVLAHNRKFLSNPNDSYYINSDSNSVNKSVWEVLASGKIRLMR